MRNESFAERVRTAREHRNWTQWMLGRRMADEAARLGMPLAPVARVTIARYEHGQKPHPLYALLLCRALQRDPGELGLGEVLTPERVEQIMASTSQQQGGPAHPPALATPTGGELLRGVPVDWERMATLVSSTRQIDRATLADLRYLTDFYGSQRCILSPRVLLPTVSSHLMMLRGQLLIAGSESARRELAMMVGESAVVTGELWHTLLDYGEAAQAFGFALRLADEVGESTVRAIALTSLAALYKNRMHHDEGIPGTLRRSVDLIDAAAAALTPSSPPHMRVWLHSARAWQHAALNERMPAEHDLEKAESALAQVTGPATGVFAPWDLDYHLVSRARVSQLFGDPRGSLPWYEKMINGPGQTGPSDLRRLHFVLKMVRACVEARELERAGSLLAGAADMVLATGLAMLVRRVQITVRSEPLLAGQASVRALSERLEDAAIN